MIYIHDEFFFQLINQSNPKQVRVQKRKKINQSIVRLLLRNFVHKANEHNIKLNKYVKDKKTQHNKTIYWSTSIKLMSSVGHVNTIGCVRW